MASQTIPVEQLENSAAPLRFAPVGHGSARPRRFRGGAIPLLRAAATGVAVAGAVCAAVVFALAAALTLGGVLAF